METQRNKTNEKKLLECACVHQSYQQASAERRGREQQQQHSRIKNVIIKRMSLTKGKMW